MGALAAPQSDVEAEVHLDLRVHLAARCEHVGDSERRPLATEGEYPDTSFCMR